MHTPADETPSVPSQTLSRGLRVLEVIALSPRGATVNEVVSRLGVHRSVVYRMVKTLEAHGLVRADEEGRYRADHGLAALAQGVESGLRRFAVPALHRLSAETGATAFLVVAEGSECITLESVEAVAAGAALAQRPGTRHGLDHGAPGLAIMSGLSPAEWAEFRPETPYRPEADEARRRGYAVSHDEVIDGLGSCAAPIPLGQGLPAAIATVYLSTRDLTEQHASAVRDAARDVARRLEADA
ncbi:IclR family transcriptional regulator [Arthrobacter sp. UM1]|uniref:IclR family transcriptional regulator n=1 Tax=Arthrobacter sp. UM1 TaxID=2766776 RepID=UPI001CF6F220|nr:IclR family transcriptional regulator [Arthrobacter sp. UM1]MCB4207267.1 IclR family transcriptional regulator [Arthrobacter sp. UM1]